MPDLTLEFELKLETDKTGRQLNPEPAYVPVLVRVQHCAGAESTEKKAFLSPEGWRNPDNGQLYDVQFFPAEAKHWGDTMGKMRNDLLEGDDKKSAS